MKRTRLLVCALLVLGTAVAVSLAQQGGGGAGGPGMGGMGGGPGMGGPGMMGGGMGMRGGPPQNTALVATEKYLFIVRGNTVYQMDVNTLELLRQKDLPQPPRPAADGAGAGRGGAAQPGDGAPGGDKRQ